MRRETTPPVHIDVWSDYVCPFCYLAEPVIARLERESESPVQVRWHAFELRPEPVPTLEPDSEYLQDIWSRAVYPMAKERGMWLRLPPVQPRSRRAHETAHFASHHGHGPAMQTAIFRAFFEHGEDIGDVDVLAGIAEDIGLDAGDLRAALDAGSYRARVLADEQLALGLGLSSVPAIVMRDNDQTWDGGLLIEGAQPYPLVADAVARVAARREPQPLERRSREP
jgi:predicted DsbA family dithiol-disulfide isomerase